MFCLYALINIKIFYGPFPNMSSLSSQLVRNREGGSCILSFLCVSFLLRNMLIVLHICCSATQKFWFKLSMVINGQRRIISKTWTQNISQCRWLSRLFYTLKVLGSSWGEAIKDDSGPCQEWTSTFWLVFTCLVLFQFIWKQNNNTLLLIYI